jgi:hypothetical protein
MEYTVVIEKRHCVGADYVDIFNCPLCKAMREQIKDFKLWMVGGDAIHGSYKKGWFLKYRVNVMYRFPTDYWHYGRIGEILNGDIQSISLSFDKSGNCTPKINYPEPTKEVIRYVSVPESIKEQKEELILN